MGSRKINKKIVSAVEECYVIGSMIGVPWVYRPLVVMHFQPRHVEGINLRVLACSPQIYPLSTGTPRQILHGPGAARKDAEELGELDVEAKLETTGWPSCADFPGC
jgi:hypothetical protein